MNYKKAMQVLEMDSLKDYSTEEIRKQYKLLALQYHPDKNITENTTEKFQLIHEAYNYLIKYDEDYESEEDLDDENNNEKGSYLWFLYSFINDILKGDNAMFSIIKKLLCSCEDKVEDFLRKFDKHILIKTLNFMKKNNKVLNIHEKFLLIIENIIKEKSSTDEYIVLNPTINDLFSSNLYKLTYNNKEYIIPLWHNELVYDQSGCEVVIKCEPVLPDNVKIDDNNNILINVEFYINDIWEKDKFSIIIGNNTFLIQTNKLKLCKHQTIVLYKQGIPRINTLQIYENSNKSDIMINIKLSL